MVERLSHEKSRGAISSLRTGLRWSTLSLKSLLKQKGANTYPGVFFRACWAYCDTHWKKSLALACYWQNTLTFLKAHRVVLLKELATQSLWRQSLTSSRD